MLRRRIAGLVALALVPSIAARAFDRQQTPAAPARLSGMVVTTETTPQPVRRAIVSFSGGDRALGHHTITDDEGRFELTALPAGRYTLSAARPTYVTITYGASRPGRPGTAISLEPGQHLSAVRVLLARGAIITGTVRDGTGEPVPNLEVRVEPRGSPAAAATSAQTVVTDDQGRYRAFGLPVGTYVVVARPRTGTSDLDVPTDANVDAALAALRQRRAVTAPPSPVPVKPKPATNFAPVYHRSQLTLDAATGVAITAGEERTGIDITLRLLSTWSVSGTVVTADAETRSMIRPMLTTMSAHSAPVTRTSDLAPDGTFRFPNVVPGRYTLAVQALSAEARRASLGAPGAQATGPCAFASQDVSVTAADVTGVSLVMRPCLRFAGRMVVGGSGTAGPEVSRLLVTLMQLAPPPSPVFRPVRRAPPAIAMDGTFTFGEFGELLPGAYQFSVEVPSSSPGRGYQLQSAVVDGRDILDTPLQLTGDSPGTTNVVLTLSDQHNSLSGTLETSARLPAVNFTVIAFTTNRSWWTSPFRRIRTARPASDGHFAFQDLPPGEYYLAAVTDLAPDDVRDAEFLAQAVATAVRVTIGEGEQKIQNLRVTGGN
ncbi:MAG TPA: carboxypeptidase-like regulatory domain-containing protein [Vicinamibacterales bacterium]|nr:carboxypeptidase-like regulatory domain-containing protein [Vicinamibacterales bacterium]